MGPAAAVQFVERLGKKVVQHTHVTSVLCPPFVSVPEVFRVAASDIFKVGAQTMHDQDEGAFTGEVSGPMLKGLAQYVILGHSERRRDMHETDKLIAKKVEAALRNGIKPILCIGENLHDREDGHSRRVVNDQLHGCLAQVTAEDLSRILITYEPVWAISQGDGKGQFASPDDVEYMFTFMRHTIEEMFGEGASAQVQMLYGGSVNPDNCKAYLTLQHCNGLLVGGASVNFEQFAAIINTAQGLTHS